MQISLKLRSATPAANVNGTVKTSESRVDEHLPVWHYMAKEIQPGGLLTLKWEASAPAEVSYYHLRCSEGGTHVEFQTSLCKDSWIWIGYAEAHKGEMYGNRKPHFNVTDHFQTVGSETLNRSSNKTKLSVRIKMQNPKSSTVPSQCKWLWAPGVSFIKQHTREPLK